jgi:hypothetical protein
MRLQEIGFTMRLTLLMFVLLASAASAEQRGEFLVREQGARFLSLQAAVDAIGDGDGTIVIAPGTYKDCAVQNGGRISYIASIPGTVTFNGGVCEGKATMVLNGRSSRVEGVTFTNTFIEDGNGAGIRMESGSLTVVGVRFVDAQSGILSSINVATSISVDRSTFSGLGKRPDGRGAHSIYVNGHGSIRVTNSRFERGTGGHYLKSRAPRIEVLGCSFDDSQGRRTDYMIDLPNGAVGRIAGNSFVSGRNKDNFGTMVAVAAEKIIHPSAGLVIENNKAWLVPGFPFKTTFVRSWTEEHIIVRGNLLASGISEFAQN